MQSPYSKTGQADVAEPLRRPAPIVSSGNAPHFSGMSTTHTTGEETAQDLLDLALPPNSPPLQRDLFVESAFSTAAQSPSAKAAVARLEAVIHTTAETLKEYLSDFGSRTWSKCVGAVVAEERRRRGSEEYIVAYKVRADKVRYSHAREGMSKKRRMGVHEWVYAESDEGRNAFINPPPPSSSPSFPLPSVLR